ncbi:MAG: pullulanase [Paracoccaceae bacterium]|nr:pullulanase [Paracoccaceae bacterium]
MTRYTASLARPQQPDKEMIPRVLLRGMLALVLASSALVIYARLAHLPVEDAPANVAVVGQRQIVISGKTDGSARVTGPDGTVIATYDSTHGGFVAGIARAVSRERLVDGASEQAPVRLVKYADGRLAILDDTTGWHADLIGFGPDNTRVFARLLD